MKNPVFDLWPYARAAYTPSVAKELGFGKTNMMERADDFAFSIAYDDRVIVSFQGTGTLSDSDTRGKVRDWVSNISAYPSAEALEKDGMTIHSGFYDGWARFKKDIDGLLEVVGDRDWLITGHSRGGALAVLCARHLAKNRGKACSCVTYGAPAQGGRKLRNEINLLPIDLTNAVHGYDIVPAMPPRRMGYRHAGKQYWMKEKWWHRFTRISDHLPSNYHKWFEKNKPT